MASNRHLGRIVALQSMYEFDFREGCGEEALAGETLMSITKRNLDQYRDDIDDIKFVNNLVESTFGNRDKLDEMLAPLAPEWPVEQIARIDRIVLEMALYELVMAAEAPPKVVINEAVELAKAFGGENSSKFVNGVLGTAFKKYVDNNQKADKK